MMIKMKTCSVAVALVLCQFVSTQSVATPDNQHSAPSFIIDMAALIEKGAAKAIRDHSGLGMDDLLLEHGTVRFWCSAKANWRFVDVYSLEVPDQSGPSALCEAKIQLIIKDTLNHEVKPAAGAPGYCYDTIDFESIDVTIYGNGFMESSRGKAHSGGTNSCNDQREISGIPEAIAKYTSKPAAENEADTGLDGLAP
ncbi:hypothetical protein [uncultured Microbulbifer sp.]|uniref:hypothetical protein n=1 Tax=uncultured Microbulbifer sp. TaxID=348147 RepID=UPI0026025C8D|nr:hypothetical protein [uncultured Microbulbifer sp.]